MITAVATLILGSVSLAQSQPLVHSQYKPKRPVKPVMAQMKTDLDLSDIQYASIVEANQTFAVERTKVERDDYGKTSYRAILDLGLLDVSPEFLIPISGDVEIIGASSDMIVLDMGEETKLKVGDLVPFKLKYMGALALMSSDYIEKKVV